LATDNPASPAEAGYLDTRLEFRLISGPSNSSLRNVAQRTRVQVLFKNIVMQKTESNTYILPLTYNVCSVRMPKHVDSDKNCIGGKY